MSFDPDGLFDTDAVIAWTDANRPGLKEHIRECFEATGDRARGVHTLMAIAFAAGVQKGKEVEK